MTVIIKLLKKKGFFHFFPRYNLIVGSDDAF